MNGSLRPSTAKIYQSDLERHLFAPAPRRNGPLRRRPVLDRVADWLRDRLLTGWSRWKALREAGNIPDANPLGADGQREACEAPEQSRALSYASTHGSAQPPAPTAQFGRAPTQDQVVPMSSRRPYDAFPPSPHRAPHPPGADD